MANVSLLEHSGMFSLTDHSAEWKRLAEHGLILNLVVQLGRWWGDRSGGNRGMWTLVKQEELQDSLLDGGRNQRSREWERD